MATMKTIESLTDAFIGHRRDLADRVRKLNDEIEAAQRRQRASLKNLAAAVVDAESRLRAAIEQSPDLFVRPRTVVVAGVKVGFVKGKGTLDWDDDAQVVKLIRKHFPDQADALIKTAETPVKAALGNLTVAELKKVGVVVEDTGDQVVIKPVDGEIDKLVAAYLKEAVEASK